MKYTANPVTVVAYRILEVGPPEDGNCAPAPRLLRLENGDSALATSAMLARYPDPVAGDYWVTQSDGYEYINPKAVFERKYSPNGEPDYFTIVMLAVRGEIKNGSRFQIADPSGAAQQIICNASLTVKESDLRTTAMVSLLSRYMTAPATALFERLRKLLS